MKLKTVFLIGMLGAVLPAHARVLCQESLASGANVSDLKAKIENCHLTRIQDFIPLLPTTLRAHYTLMHHSQSLHEASPQNPRAILYGEDGHLIVTFNGESSQNHFDHLEVMEFKKHQFDLYDFQFPERAGGAVVMSGPNPVSCVSCHSEITKPNWSTYPLWPGAYGGEDDFIFRANAQNSSELKNYTEFLNTRKNSERYAAFFPKPLDPLPNTQLASLLQGLNFDRISQRIKSRARLHAFRYAIISAASCFYSDHFQNVEETIPVQLRKRYFLISPALYYDKTWKANGQAFLLRYLYLTGFEPTAPEAARTQEFFELFQPRKDTGLVRDHIVASLRYVLENLGEFMADWSTELLPGSYDLENGYLGVADLRRWLAPALLDGTADEKLKRYFEQPILESRELDYQCGELQRLSLTTLAQAGLSLLGGPLK